jgi:hypothetical protein
MTKIRPAASPSPTTLRGVSGGPDAARRQVIQITAGFARTRRKPLSFPRFPRRFDVPWFPGVGLPDSGHATGWIWLARSFFFDRAEHAQRRGTAAPASPRPVPARQGAGVGARAFAAAAQGPARGQGQPDPSRPRAGRPAHRPVGRPAADNLAASPRQSRCASVHCPAPGEPWKPGQQARPGPGSGRARAPGPGVRSSRTRWPDGESSSCRAVSQPHGFQPPRVP